MFLTAGPVPAREFAFQHGEDGLVGTHFTGYESLP